MTYITRGRLKNAFSIRKAVAIWLYSGLVEVKFTVATCCILFPNISTMNNPSMHFVIDVKRKENNITPL